MGIGANHVEIAERQHRARRFENRTYGPYRGITADEAIIRPKQRAMPGAEARSGAA